jgi:hypothetical protein
MKYIFQNQFQYVINSISYNMFYTVKELIQLSDEYEFINF